MRSLLPVDPVDLFGAAIGGIVGRVVMFFLAAWLGYAAGFFCAAFDGYWGFFNVEFWKDVIGGLLISPFSWLLSMIVGFLNPWVAMLTLGYGWFAFQFFWGDRDAIKLLGAMLVFESVRSFIYQENSVGIGVVLLIGVGAGVVVVAWTWSRVLYEAEMRRLEEIGAENAQKRAEKEAAARGRAAEEAAVRERIAKGDEG